MDKEARYRLYKGQVWPGWWPILDKYIPIILKEDPDVQLYIKEKYGYLRIEMCSKVISMDRQIELENAAEEASSTVCEISGS